MVKHIVLFKLTSYTNSSEKERQIEEMEEIFSQLPKQLNFITEFNTGRNFSTADHAWDFVIDSVFMDKGALNRYQVSAEHQQAIKQASHIDKIKAVVDYEFQKR